MELTFKDALAPATVTRRGAWQWLTEAGTALLGARRAQHAAADAGPALRTTAALNLRARPSATAKIRLVVPHGAAVRDLAGTRNGYARIAYNGATGWAYDAFLAEPAPSA